MKIITAVSLLFVTSMAYAQPTTLNQCTACHAVDKKLVGPSFKDIAAKYKGRADSVDYLTKSIKAGGVNRWGPIPMPAQKQLSDAQAKELAAWVLSK